MHILGFTEEQYGTEVKGTDFGFRLPSFQPMPQFPQ